MKKKIIILLCIILTWIYSIETIKVFSFHQLRPILTLEKQDAQTVLSWSSSAYPCYYEVEIMTRSSQKEIMPKYRVIRKKYTLQTTLALPDATLPTYYRVTAHGLFQPIGDPSKVIRRKAEHDTATQPEIISLYDDPTQPAGNQPLLLWHTLPGAVYYELEFLTQPPETPNGITLSKSNVFSTREIFTNGYYADLRPYQFTHLYWRVRALDFSGNPVGVFSVAQSIYIDPARRTVQKPIINNFDRAYNFSLPLYPVYSWIPLQNAVAYELELLSDPPEFENGIQPSATRIWSKIADDASDCYDDFARLYPGTYYWRVRAIDEAGDTIGVYSDTETVIITEQPKRVNAATFGDSITHGGGAISYSPANPEYNYQTYLDFPTLNLGKSGDTSTTTAERFDSDVLPFKPKNLLILCGANSIRAGTPAKTIIRDLITIRTKCYMNDIRPIFLTLMPINPDNIYNAFATETADNWREVLTEVNEFIRKQPYVIDLEPYFYDDRGLLATQFATDGLHPDIKGKKLMAEIINAHRGRVLR